MAGERDTTITVMSNDGSNTLATVDYSSYRYSITVTITGFSAEHDGTFSDYVYVGTGTFLGISNSPNTTTPDYAIGDIFYPSSDSPTFYIVEEVEEDEEMKTVTFDLSTLNLSAGTHEITVKARASGYTDSPASNAVSYVVAGDTVQVSGTWYFNEDLGALKEDNHFEDQMVSFTSNNTAFTCISEELKGLVFGSIEVYFNGTWANQAYRTITFVGVQTVSQEFYEWLVENAQPQIEAGTYIFKEILTEPVSVYDLEFSSNGNTYCGMGDPDGDLDLVYMTAASSGTKVYYLDSETWKDAGYKTIVVSKNQAVYKESYDWFVENTLITFTIQGTQYQAERDMTWDEWVASEYNTDGFFIETYYGRTYVTWFDGAEAHYSISYNGTFEYSDSIIQANYSYGLTFTHCCFVAGTPVLMANGSQKAIETVSVGDTVLTYNEETNKYENGVVVGLIKNMQTIDMARLNFEDGTSIEMNAYHPICTTDGWKSLTRHKDLPLLEVDDFAVSVNGKTLKILSVDRWTENPPIVTYNLDIEDNDNYFVGDTPILVHNAGTCPT